MRVSHIGINIIHDLKSQISHSFHEVKLVTGVCFFAVCAYVVTFI